MKKADPLRAEIDLVRVERDPLSAEVDLLRVEIDPPGPELDPLRVEVDLLRVEADRLSAEVDPLRTASVLLVAVNYAPEQGGFAPRSTAMARDLAAIAEQVVVFTGAPASARSAFSRIPTQTRRDVEHDRGVRVVRHQHHLPSQPNRPAGLSGMPGLAGLSGLGGLSGLSRARYERSFLRAVLRSPLRNAPDVVIGVLPSVGAAVAAARIAHRCRVPLILVVQDLAASLTWDGGLVGAAVARGQAEALREATRVVLIGAGLRTPVVALGVDRARIDVLADWSLTLPERPEPTAARARIGVAADDFVVLHIGNIGFGQDVPTLVRAARRIARRFGSPIAQHLRLVLVGEGSQRESLETAAADLPDVRFLNPVSAGEYPGLLAAADALVVTELPGCPDRTLPSRLETYLRAGRPVVAAINPDGDADRLLRSVPAAAMIVPPGDSGALAMALIRLRDDEHELAGLRAGAGDYADAAISGGGTGRGMRDVVRTVLTNPR